MLGTLDTVTNEELKVSEAVVLYGVPCQLFEIDYLDVLFMTQTLDQNRTWLRRKKSY